MSIFPFLDPPDLPVDISEELPMAEEYAWDFDKSDFKTKDGKMYLVTGNEAVKVWIWKIFKTPRYRYLIYSSNYGNDLEELIGKGLSSSYIKSEAERLVKEAILSTLGRYVLEIKNFDIDFSKDKLIISLKIITPYGEVVMNV